ncbi:hypothetical protein SDC9_188685 [bioreactor metagenome]|uniref:Uncharacterized protein n=1 Tax=bioreactor metagenome TaxID=1076179 RepID=A0A645I0U2_9ZZZZ
MKNKYIELLQTNQFIKAESLKVSITKQRFCSLIITEGIIKETIVYQKLDDDNSIKELSCYIINKKYDDELGLQLDINVRESGLIS